MHAAAGAAASGADCSRFARQYTGSCVLSLGVGQLLSQMLLLWFHHMRMQLVLSELADRYFTSFRCTSLILGVKGAQL